MNILFSIMGAIVAIFSVILLHELGHFLVARAFNVKILRFSIGFGKTLGRYVGKRGTEYVLAVLPLGGYVKMLGEGDEVTSPDFVHEAYNQKPVLVRMMIILSGPAMNFLIALLVYWIVYVMGVTQIKPVVGTVAPSSIAAQAGIQAGDQIVQIDGKQVSGWQQVMMAMILHMGSKQPMLWSTKPLNGHQVTDHRFSLSNWHVNQRQPNILESLGIAPYQPSIPPLVVKVVVKSPADQAGIQAGDTIIRMNGTKINDWRAILDHIHHHPGHSITLLVMRKGKLMPPMIAHVGRTMRNKHVIGYLGIQSQPLQWPPSLLKHISYSALTAFIPAARQVWRLTVFNFNSIVNMVAGKLSLHTLGGPITIFQAAGEASQAGVRVYLGFIAFISLTIGFINLLPIPGLDGGHLFFQVMEGVLGKPVPTRIQMVSLTIGIGFLVFIMFQATLNDLARLFLSS